MAKQEESFGKISGLIIQGRKLAAKDPNGLSDPFVECGPIDKKGEFLLENKKERKTIKSKVVRKSLSPVWRQAFEIVCDRRTKGIKVQVWDWDYIGASEFMGEFAVSVAEMTPGKEIEAWFPLRNRPSKPKEIVSGEVLFRYVYNRDGVSSSNITEEERGSLDDARSGDISLVWESLLKFPASNTVQSTGLPNLFKWAATSSVKERLDFLNKHKSKIFEHLTKVSTTFPSDPKIVFYGLGAFTFFSKLVEAKPMFSDEHAQVLVKQLQNPPKIFSEDDLPLHIANLLITLANICTFKFDSQYSAEVVRCQELLLQKGAVAEALSCLKNYDKHESVRRSALSVLLKAARSNDRVKDSFTKLGVPEEMLRLCRRTKNAMLKWLAVEVLDTFARGDNKSYGDAIVGLNSFIKCLSGNFGSAEGPHPASLCTATVYLLEAVSTSITDAIKTEIAEEKTMISGIVSSFLIYRKSIPKQNQRPLLAERILILLLALSSHVLCRSQIVDELDPIVDMIYKNAKVLSVHKYAQSLFETLVLGSNSDTAIKKLRTTSFVPGLASLDKDTAKLYDKIREKLKESK